MVGTSGMMMGRKVRGLAVAGVLSLATQVLRSATTRPSRNFTGVTWTTS